MIDKVRNNSLLPKKWKDKNNKPVSCNEKIKILNENILEIDQMTEDAVEDAILMGVNPEQVVSILTKALNKKINLKK